MMRILLLITAAAMIAPLANAEWQCRGGRCVWVDDALETPAPAIDQALMIFKPQPQQRLIHLGYGSGAMLKRAAQLYRAHAVGVKSDDVAGYDLSQADYIYVYLPADKLERIRWETLKPGARVVSLTHELPIEGARRWSAGERHWWVYDKPADAEAVLTPKWKPIPLLSLDGSTPPPELTLSD